MADSRQKTALIPWRMRRDLEVHPADEGDGTWTIKDPVQLSYFRVENEELEFLQLLDGRRSWQELTSLLSERFPGTEFSDVNLQMFLGTAIKGGLLSPTSVGYGAHLAEAAQQARSSAVYRKFFSLISHRFRGIDPTSLLQILDRAFGWIFRPAFLRLGVVVFVAAAVLILSRWSQLQAELPSISQLVTPRNALMLGITVVFIKILHEIGHGLTCYHYGGECHELGCIVVGFLPLLYCDVSDSWLQRNRTHRICVAAAGIAVELFLAAVFGLLWVASVPGLLHTFFLNVMLLCSLNTVLVNGNPLLRYDGYYVLCDILKIPNLSAEARGAAVSAFDRIVFGLKQPATAVSSGFRTFWLPLFGTASMAYRLFVLTAILTVIHTALKPLRLEGISYLLAISVALGLLLPILAFVRQRVRAVRRNGTVSIRAVAGLVLLATVLGFVLLWPFSYSIEAPFTLTPGLSSPVYISAPGHIHARVSVGETVNAGQTLAALTNPELELAIAQAEGELQVREARMTHLAGIRSTSTTAAASLPAAETAVEHARGRLATLHQKVDRLTLRSPSAGVVYAPRSRPVLAGRLLDQTFWTGTPLDSRNESTWLSEQTLVCLAGTPDQIRATVYVTQKDIEFVQTGAAVELTFNSLPGHPVRGAVARVNTMAETNAPPELAVTRMLTTVGTAGLLAEKIFTAKVRLNGDQGATHPPLYSTGIARIRCQNTSLWSRFWRLLSHTFAFEL